MLKWIKTAAVAVWARCAGRPRLVGLANIAEGTHTGNLTRMTDGALTTRNLLGKLGSDAMHVVACGANDIPVGVITDEAVQAEEPVNVALLGSAEDTRRMVAAAPVAAGALVFTAANGKVTELSATPGTYYGVGLALSAAAADGDEIEVDPCIARKTVVAGT